MKMMKTDIFTKQPECCWWSNNYEARYISEVDSVEDAKNSCGDEPKDMKLKDGFRLNIGLERDFQREKEMRGRKMRISESIDENRILELVDEWNSMFDVSGRSSWLKNLSPVKYETVIFDHLLELAEGDHKLALAIFNHDKNDFGWMYGNVEGRLKSAIAGLGESKRRGRVAEGSKRRPLKESLIKCLSESDIQDKVVLLSVLAGIKCDYSNREVYESLRRLRTSFGGSEYHTVVEENYKKYRYALGASVMNNIMEKNKSKEAEKRSKELSKKNKEKFKKEGEKKKKKEKSPLAQAIRAKGDDQEEAADKVDVHKSTISRIKTGTRKPSFDTMKKLATVYGKGLVSQLLEK